MKNNITLYLRLSIIVIILFALTVYCVNVYNNINQFLSNEQITLIVIVYVILSAMVFVDLFEIFKLKKLENKKIDIYDIICQ